MVVLSLSLVPEATGSRVHDIKNMHICCCHVHAQYSFFRSFSFLLVSSVFFMIAFLLSLASASIVSVLYIVTWFFCMYVCKFHVDFVSIGQKRTV